MGYAKSTVEPQYEISFLEQKKWLGNLGPRINIENVGWSTLIYEDLQAHYPRLKMLNNVVVFIQGSVSNAPTIVC
jgi:hypothetical protein